MAFTRSRRRDDAIDSQLATTAPPKLRSVTPESLDGTQEDKNTRWIPLGKILSRPQVREHFDEKEMEELAESFRVHGQKTACLVYWSEEEGTYLLVAGERRFRAAKEAGLDKLKCDILDAQPTPQQVHELQLIENVQRSNLSFYEEAKAYQKFVDEFHLSAREIARRTGKSQPTISRALKFMELPEDIRSEVAKSDAVRTLAESLARLDTHEEKRELLDRYLRKEVTADQALKETAPRDRSGTKKTATRPTRVKKARGIDYKATGKKKHTNTDYALGALDWCEDLALDKRALTDRQQIVSRLREMLLKLSPDSAVQERAA